jgi:hypothetical protein
MTTSNDNEPVIERSDPLEPEDAASHPSLDSEIDFDDERDEDQLPLDEVEAAEANALLDDPQALSNEED